MKPPRVIQWDGVNFFLQSTGFYHSSRKDVYGERLLHRAIWSQSFRAIPNGFYVHHKNHNWQDNRIENLELMSASEHSKRHFRLSQKNAIIRAKRRAGLEKAREAAREWHGTEVGREWHRRNGIAAMKARLAILVERKCQVCGKSFKCHKIRPRKWCSERCYQRQVPKKFVTLKCVICGRAFQGFKYHPRKACSKSCSSVMAYKNRIQNKSL